MNDSTNGAARPSVDTQNKSAEKSLNRLIGALSNKLAGKDVTVKSPAGDEFKAGGRFEVWGTLARQAGNTADAVTAREAITNVLIDYSPTTQAEVWSRLDADTESTSPDSDDAMSRTSELSNADRFLKHHGNDVRFVVDTGEFLVWDGKRWLRDTKKHTRVRAMMAKASRWIDLEVIQEPNDEIRKSLRGWAVRSENRSVITASTDLLTTRRRIWVNSSELNANHDLLNCQNGTVDLRTGVLKPHDRNDLITLITPVDYQNDAFHPLWTDTVTRFIPDDELRDYVQRLVGYAATGHASEKAFPICWGGGNNGKGSIFETIAKRGLGTDYAVSISPDAIVNSGKHGQQAQERANLKFYGKRMSLFEETADGDTLDAGAVKRLASGGDTMEARPLFLESFNFNPTHSVFLLTNAEPRVNCFDLAMKTRIKFIHFGVQVEPNGKIRHQLENDVEVHRAVLAWIVEGSVKYFHEGLAREPQAVKDATVRFFREQDAIGQFLAECFEVAEPGNNHYSESKQDIYKRYLAWTEDQGFKHPLSKIGLGRELEKRGFPNIGGSRYAEYDGLKLRSEYEDYVHSR